ncbi:MAG: poly(3-hydroxybutyrate) depolymerase [Oceanospirillaceae bacterium]|nr:poly(3-hydroxybutyrate) depolymerase [Oceanospirillaceae bacterium]|tara:strand:+ start:453 stop:1622 length:1170 start_codon:yes stop_codon:yes gene_type:complete
MSDAPNWKHHPIANQKLAFSLLIASVVGLSACSSNDEATKQTDCEPEKLALETVEKAAPLGSYRVNLAATSVSGLSSGAFMTSQLYMAHSDIMVGAGVIAGGPYLCALSWPLSAPLFTATTTCMNPNATNAPNLPRLEQLTTELAEENKISPINNLIDDRLYVFSGQADETVHPPVVDATVQYFTNMGVPVGSINYDNSVNAGHAIITDHADDVPCAETASPYINNCNFMQSTRIIEQIYPGAQPPAASASGQLIEFDQTEFLPNEITSMSEKGFVYVPNQCADTEANAQNTECKIHIAVHGCQQGYESIGDQYYTTTGYNQMADSNDLIILYPQVSVSHTIPYNPQGCWDFWGYSSYNQFDPDFYTQEAPQIKAIHAMLERMSGAGAQ